MKINNNLDYNLQLINALKIANILKKYHDSYFILTYLDKYLNLYGVEYIKNKDKKYNIEYINTGDSYTNTIIYFKGKYIIKSTGDIVEKYYKKYE